MGGEGKRGEATAAKSVRTHTGISGFDAVLGGGLPSAGVTVVLGTAGSGKTILGMQVLSRGAADDGEPGILVAFEESAERIRANTRAFSWSGAADVTIIDAQLSQSVEQGGEFDLQGMLVMLGATAHKLGARRIVFDGLDMLLGHLRDEALIRREAFRLRDWVHESGLTAIITGKAGATSLNHDFLEFMADCVVCLDHRVVQGVALRFIRVPKYRGAAHSANEIPFAITRDGIEVASNTTTELVYAVSTERVSTGIERLDTMLDGGYYRGSSVLITGAPGTAKTSIASSFAHAAGLRGERTAYVSFDESPDQIVRNVASIGIDFASLVQSGTLALHSLRGRAESPQAQVARIREIVRTQQPRNLIVDPLSALALHSDEANHDNAALQLLDLAKTMGITILNTSLLGTTAALTEQTPLNISTIADTWLHVSYVSKGGERNRALTIIKARGTGHSHQVRELVLTKTGVTLADVYAVEGEVLMGTLRWERENEARRERTTAHIQAVLREQRAELALAETKAHRDTLARAQAIQEAELAQIKIEVLLEADAHADETQELIVRRRAISGEHVEKVPNRTP